MTRHARNCTAGAVYTYHEKKKDAEASGYGTRAERLGKHSVKDFDCCSLTLQPCRNPVVTKDGYLFDKEAILEYIISKKAEHARKMKLYEKQLKKDESEMAELAAAEKQADLVRFMKRESNISGGGATDDKPTASTSVSNLANGKNKQLPSFWVPSQLPDAKRSRVEKPDSTIYCPVSGKVLRAKDLIDVKWTPVKDADNRSVIAKQERYMCAVTHDVLGNSVPCAVIRTTGDVVTMECVERLIRPTWKHPLSGEPLTERDIIVLQRGGTGYAATNTQLEAKDKRVVLQA